MTGLEIPHVADPSRAQTDLVWAPRLHDIDSIVAAPWPGTSTGLRLAGGGGCSVPCLAGERRYLETVTIYVLDCGIGNVGALHSMYRRLCYRAELIATPRRLGAGDRLILPGVGAFDAGAEALQRHGFPAFIAEAVAAGHPLLGICLGMQLLCRGSEEGSRPGLGLIAADVVRLVPGDGARVPHMGWNVVTPVRVNPLVPLGSEEQRFYFTHSYRVRCEQSNQVWATTRHGTVFPSAIGVGRVMGVQFHPEKSHRFGKALLERFATMEIATT